MIRADIIRDWWYTLKNTGDPYEFRILTDRGTFSGYFTDVEDAIKSLMQYDGNGLYATLNPCRVECMSMTQGGKIIRSSSTTGDDKIAGRNWILIDIDPERFSGINATNEEKGFAKKMAEDVRKYLQDAGFQDPVVCDSANGYHLYYRVMLANTPENTALVENFLKVLDMYFSNEHCKIDTSVFNASRIAKIMGTTSAKGRNTQERPQRLSMVLEKPAEIKVTDIAYIEKIAGEMKKFIEPQKTRENRYSGEQFDLDKFLDTHNIQIEKRTNFKDGEKIILKECPFNHDHKMSAVFRTKDGALSFKCFHNSCQSYGWKDFRLHFDPKAYDEKDHYDYDRRHKYDRQPLKRVEVLTKETEDKGRFWLEIDEEKWVDPKSFHYVPTGVKKIDESILGLMLGDVTIISGLAGSGKTSLIDFFILNAIEKGHKVACWSGELQAHRFISWLDQMAAGKTRVKQMTGYDNVYHAPKDVAEKINKWVKGKFWLYNNKYKNSWTQIEHNIDDLIEKEHPDLFILDNLTALDLDCDGWDKNEKQKTLINAIKDKAKEKNVHIILVCHPRKEQSFHMLRMESIAGSSDLGNLCDNILIVHRGGQDLKKRMMEFFSPDIAEEYSLYDTVVEIAKNRSHGRVNTLIGMYFERETRRFLNEMNENIVYGWDTEARTIQPSIAWLDDALAENNEFDVDNQEIEDLPF